MSAHEEIARAAFSLGDSFKAEGRLDQAQVCYEQALILREQAFGADSPEAAEVLRALSFVCQAQGRLPDAERHLRRALAAWEKQPDYDGEGLHSLAGLCGAQGRAAEAETLLQRAIALKEARLGPDHFDVAMRLGDLCTLYEAQGRAAESRPLRERLIPILAREWGPFDVQIAGQLETLADLCEKLGAAGDAARHRATALEIRQRAAQPRN